MKLDVLTWQATIASAEGPKGYTMRLVLLIIALRIREGGADSVRLKLDDIAESAALSRTWVQRVATDAVREGWLTRQMEPGAKKSWAAYVFRPSLPDGTEHSTERVLLGPDGLRSPQCSCGNSRLPGYSWCQTCKNTYHAKWRQTHPLSGEARMKSNARAYANVYQRRGKLRKEKCWECGAQNAQKHHEDYSQPLQVAWLCPPCHQTHHRQARTVSCETKGRSSDRVEAVHGR